MGRPRRFYPVRGLWVWFMTEITQVEAIRRSDEAGEEHEVCPECGEEFEGTDMTRGGELVFLHSGRQMCSVETEVERVVG